MAEDYEEMGDQELAAELEKRGLSSEGTKDELIARLELNDYGDGDDEAASGPGDDPDESTPVEPEVSPPADPEPEDSGPEDDFPSSPHEPRESARRVLGRTKQQQQKEPSQNYAVMPDGRRVPLS